MAPDPPAKGSPSCAELADYVESHPGQSPCWGDGVAGLYPVLAWLNTHPVVRQREAVAEGGVLAGIWLTARAHHNQVGTSVAWATRYMAGPSRAPGTDVEDLPALFDLAGRAWGLRNLLAEVRQGVRRFEADDHLVVLTFEGDPRLDALDRLLDLVDDIDQPELTRPWDPRLRTWLVNEGVHTGWERAPAWVHREFRGSAATLIERYPAYLPPELDVGGFTMAEATRVLVELLARGLFMHAATLAGSTEISVVLPLLESDALITDIAGAAQVSVERVALILDLLTLDLDRCPDPCLTPLIPVSRRFVVPMSSLIVPSSPVRNLIALLQADPARFGRAGAALGSLGARTIAATLGRLDGARMASGVRVVRPDRAHAGDLDVVVCDPGSRKMAVFEVMWRIGPDGSAEVARAEEDAHAKRAQVARVRSDIEMGRASPRWPAGWPDVSAYETRWFILTPSVLPVRSVEDDRIIVRSHQLLSRMLRSGATVEDLIRLMDEPPYPPPELCERQWEQIEYGDYLIEFDVSRA